MTLTPIQSAIAAIKSAPRLDAKRIHWAGNPETMVKVAIAIIGANDQAAASKAITDATGVQDWTLRHFVRGNNAQGKACDAILNGLKAVGLKPIWLNAKRSSTISAAEQARTEAPAPATKPIVLATTNKGEVIVADPPAQVSAPQVMAAKPGEFATKENGTRCVLDTKTKDILVIATRRIEFGTPAWCEKMVEINSKPKA